MYVNYLAKGSSSDHRHVTRLETLDQKGGVYPFYSSETYRIRNFIAPELLQIFVDYQYSFSTHTAYEMAYYYFCSQL